MTLLCCTRRLVSILTFGLLAVLSAFSLPSAVGAQEVVSCAAPASALTGAYVTVNADQEQVNVRSGPNSYLYGKVGILYTYESAPAIGRSPGGEWIQVACPGAPGGTGWVYAANVTLTASADLPVVAIPVTATPLFTATVDPILAAAFPTAAPTSTRLPTFTPAAPPPLPVFTESPSASASGNRYGAFTIGVATLGLAALFLSFVIKR